MLTGVEDEFDAHSDNQEVVAPCHQANANPDIAGLVLHETGKAGNYEDQAADENVKVCIQ